MKHLRYSK